MKGDIFQSRLRAKFAKCICTSCKRRGCKLRLGSLPTHSLILIDADKYRGCYSFKGRLCDYILFYLGGSLSIAVVELKSGLIKADVAQKQIENGSKVAEQITEPHRVSNFLPILLYGRRVKRLDIQTLKKVEVRFQGKDYMIIIERCGSQLSEIIRKYPVS
jgi:hypothetical protein